MTTSGTSDFNITGGQLILYAYSLIGLRRTELLAQHMEDARLALNMLQASWGNDTPNLWTVELVSVDLTEGVATYNVDADTIMVLDAYLRTGDLDDVASLSDRIIWPLSRTEYAAMPNKSLSGAPTTFWFNRLLAPTITLWPVPDTTSSDNDVHQLQYYRCKVMDDALVPNGVTLDIPRWWQLAIAFGLADLLAFSYPPEDPGVADKIAARALRELSNAKEQDTENVPLFLMPQVSSYYPK